MNLWGYINSKLLSKYPAGGSRLRDILYMAKQNDRAIECVQGHAGGNLDTKASAGFNVTSVL